MRIYAFVAHWPSLYKPYYDAHFADLVRNGHDLVVLSTGRGGAVSEKARAEELPRRTRYLMPDELRQVALRAPALLGSLLAGPGRGLRAAVRAGAADGGGPKNRLKAAGRALLLPRDPPDLCLVHSHEVLRLVPWLREIYPECPVLLYYYGGTPPEAGAGAYGGLDAALLRLVDAVLTCSGYARRELLERGADPGRVHVLPLAFDLDDFRPPAPRTYRRRDRLDLLSVGRLSPGKGYADVLDALVLVRRARPELAFRYVVVGNGVLREELAGRVERQGLGEVVTLAGAMDNRAVRELYGRSDALVLPSYSTPGWSETQGTVIQEAMLLEALVLTTRTGGVPDSVPPWMEPFQVPERSPEALADAIGRLGRMPASEMARLGRMNRQWVVERFDVRDFNRRLIEIGRSYRTASP